MEGINAIKKISRAVITLVILIMTAALLTVNVGATSHTDTTNLSQTISSGTLATEIRNASGVAVASPQVIFSSLTTPPLSCETTTATLGTDSERIYVDNPDATGGDGWTLSIAATGGSTSTWTDGGTNEYDFNDPTSGGCSDGETSPDGFAGQMSIDPTVGTITADCASCGTTGVSTGTSSAFDEGTTDSITLMEADASSADVGKWYLEDVALSQTVPAGQNAGTYNIDMTITVVSP